MTRGGRVEGHVFDDGMVEMTKRDIPCFAVEELRWNR
jgi:hypothetical protein